MRCAYKITSFLVIVAVLCNMTNIAFAYSTDQKGYCNDNFCFYDGERKENVIVLSQTDTNTTNVEHYIDNNLINRVTIVMTSEYDGNDAELSISIEDIINNRTVEYTDHVSTYVRDTGVVDLSSLNNRSYTYLGKINYNIYYDEFGVSHSDKLSVYQDVGATDTYNKTINASTGDYVSVLIGVIANVISYYYNPLAAFASSLFYKAAEPFMSLIVGGIIYCSFTKQYKVEGTPVNVKAKDVSTGRERVYPSEKYRVKLTDGSYTSSYKYDGYLPWNNSTVAYWMFCDFWNYSYPGVASYS